MNVSSENKWKWKIKRKKQNVVNVYMGVQSRDMEVAWLLNQEDESNQ